MKKQLNDLMEADIKLVPDKEASQLPEGVLARVSGVFSKIGVTNKNNRTYSSDLWERVIEDVELQERIGKRMLVGEAEHPESTQSDIKRIAHVITSLKIEENNVIGEADILDTPNGRIVNTLYRAGVPVGVSSRALGETSAEMDGVSEVIADSYEFMTFDSTIDPSFDAYPGLLENVDFVSSLEKAINEKRIDKVMGARLLERMGEGCIKDSKCSLLLESMKKSLSETDEKDIQATTVYVPSADMNKEDADKAKKDEKKEPPVCKKCGKKHWAFQSCKSTGAGSEKDKEEKKEDEKKEESVRKITEMYITDIGTLLKSKGYEPIVASEVKATIDSMSDGEYDKLASAIERNDATTVVKLLGLPLEKKEESIKKLKEAYPDVDSEDAEKRIAISKGNKGELASDEWKTNMKREIARKKQAGIDLTPMEKTFIEVEGMEESKLEEENNMKSKFMKLKESYPDIEDEEKRLVLSKGNVGEFGSEEWVASMKAEIDRKQASAEGEAVEELTNLEKTFLEIEAIKEEEALAPKPAEELPAEIAPEEELPLESKKVEKKEEKKEEISIEDQVKNQAELLINFEKTEKTSKKTLEARVKDIKDLKEKLGSCGEAAKTTIDEFKEEIVKVNKRYNDIVEEMTEAVKNNVITMTKIIKEKALSIRVIEEMKKKLEKQDINHYREKKLAEISSFYTYKTKAQALLERCSTKAGMDKIADLLRESAKKKDPTLHSKVDETLEDASLLESEDTVGQIIKGI